MTPCLHVSAGGRCWLLAAALLTRLTAAAAAADVQETAVDVSGRASGRAGKIWQADALFRTRRLALQHGSRLRLCLACGFWLAAFGLQLLAELAVALRSADSVSSSALGSVCGSGSAWLWLGVALARLERLDSVCGSARGSARLVARLRLRLGFAFGSALFAALLGTRLLPV